MFLFWSGEKNEGMWGIGIRSGEWSLAGENPGPPPPAVTLRGPDFNQLVSEDITKLLSVAGLVFPLSMRNRIQLREREREREGVSVEVSVTENGYLWKLKSRDLGKTRIYLHRCTHQVQVSYGFSHRKWLLLNTPAKAEISENSSFRNKATMSRSLFGFQTYGWLSICFWQPSPAVFEHCVNRIIF